MSPFSLAKIILFLTLSMLVFPLNLQADSGTKTEVGQDVAMVNDTGINRAEYDRALDEARKQFARIGNEQAVSGETAGINMQQEVLDRLIDLELMRQDGIRRGITISENLVEENFKSFLRQFPTEEDFNGYLKENNIVAEDIRKRIQQGLLMDRLQSQVKKELTAGIKVSDSEIKEFYENNLERFKRPEQVRASHILITVAEDADDAAKIKARKKIEAIQKQLKNGKDFAELARSDSQCASSAKDGDLGFFGRDQMVKPFEETAFRLNAGEISDVIETRFGYHLIRTEEKREAGTVRYEEVKEQIAQFLAQNRLDLAQQAYLKNLRDQASITTFLQF